MHPQFLICSDRRTGSHMLATALSGHSQLRVAGEVCVRPELFGLPPIDLDLPQHRRFSEILRQASDRYHGFVIHRWHAAALEVMAGNPALQVLYLRREGWLAQLASDRIALQTNVWHVAPQGSNYLSDDGRTDAPPTAPEITLPLRVCRQFLRAARARDAAALWLFRRHARFHLTYEQLRDDWPAMSRRIQSFLRLDVEEIQPVTQRQEQRPLSQIIRNLPEIQQAFAGTRWSAGTRSM